MFLQKCFWRTFCEVEHHCCAGEESEAWKDFAQDRTVGDKKQSFVSLSSADFSLSWHLIKETKGFILIFKKLSSLIF